MTQFEVTDDHLRRAREMGMRHAAAEQSLDVLFPRDQMVEEEDVRSLAFLVTGLKLDPESFEATMLAANYTEGYWEVWDAD